MFSYGAGRCKGTRSPCAADALGSPAIVPFLAFATEIRKIIFTAKLIESINYQLRTVT